MKYIKLTQGKHAIVDDEDFEELNKVKWFYDNGYAARKVRLPNGKRRTLHMHTVVNKTPEGMLTDHVNQNRSDNRKTNLRAVKHAQNVINCKTLSTNKSGFRGVCWKPNTSKKHWVAFIYKKYKQYYLGYFATAPEAAKAYDEAAKKLHGKYANLNFPERL